MSNNPRARRQNASKGASSSSKEHKKSTAADNAKVSSARGRAVAAGHRVALDQDAGKSASGPTKRDARSRTTKHTLRKSSASRASSAYSDQTAVSQQPLEWDDETVVFDQEFVPVISSTPPSSSPRRGFEKGRVPVMPEKGKRKRGFGRAKKIAIVVVAVIVVLGIAGGSVAYAAMGQANELKAKAGVAMTDINEVMADIKNKDYDGAVNAALDAKNASADIQEMLDDPLWDFIQVLPVVGEDVKNVKVAVDALQIATGDALVPLTSALQTTPLSDLIRSDKSIDLEAMGQLMDAVAAAAPAMQECTDMIESLPDFKISQIQNAFGGAKDKIGPANELFQQVADMAPIFATLLGANGDRTYLVAAQNSAELRAAGGFPGAIGTMTIRNGVISMEDFASVYDVLPGGPPASAGITDVERALFDDDKDHLGRNNDLSAIPDFTRVASIWAQVCADKGEPVDGVISITPSVVQDVLALTGPITLSDGTTLDGTNATKVLEHDLYWKYLSTGTDTEANSTLVDALFAETAAKAMTALFSQLGGGGLTDFFETIMDDMETREVMVWLTNADEQAKLAALECSGTLGGSVEQPELGVFVTSMVPSKLGWYVDIDTTVGMAVDNADGTVTYPVTTTVTNSLTADERDRGSKYIIGVPYYSWPKGDVHPWVYFVAPIGGSITDLQDDGGAQITSDIYAGVQVIKTEFALNAGETVTCTYNVTVAAGAEDPLAVTGTPLLTEYRTAG